MKFLCPNCKAKYQISDEKIAGRTLKMDCRRCNHPIVIRGDAARRSRTSSASLSPAQSRQRQSYAGPAPTRGSTRGSLGADFRKNAAVPAKPTALDQWHVAINDVPVGPMKRDEVSMKISAGAITKSSLCWREGFDDWRELRNVPELSMLLRHAAAPAAPARPAPPPPGRGALGARGLSGPASRPGRPPTARQSVPHPQQSRPAASRSGAQGKVVPIGGRVGNAAPAVSEFGDDLLEDEPTRVGSHYDFAQMEAEHRREQEAKRAAEEAERVEAEGRYAREHRAEEARRHAQLEEDQRRAGIGLAPSAEIAHSDAFDPFASQSGGLVAARSAGEPAFAAPPAEMAAVPLEAIPERRERAIPIGAWIAIAGAISFGMVLAIMVGTHYLTQPPQIAATQPAPLPVPAPAHVEPTLEVPDIQPVAEVDPAPEDVVEVPPETAPPVNGTGGQRPSVGSSGGGTNNAAARTPSSNLSAEDRERLARMAGDNTTTAPVAVRTTPLDRDTGQGGTQLTSDQVRTVVNRERNAVTRCYETAARQAGTAPGLRLDVEVTVGGSGTVTRANARGQSFGNITDCIERTVLRWRFPRTGAESRISIPFVFQGRD